jgi:hypothetical protein
MWIGWWKHAVSIFRANDGDSMIHFSPEDGAAHFSEAVACTNQSTRQFNPTEYLQNCHCHENLKSHKKVVTH